ncbi:siderophore ferric iron reductase [Vibrio harveyi]|uniref:siderophore ferric iron reductase n=1 Tax=Vibrio harveyi TaxID=669 RepID=UPI001EFE38FE|nr:siderophore ferric iron reductase [Vibrio harveyi]MCG9547069.1 siderophore ferric iron reductase [Vibrio harveyi]
MSEHFFPQLFHYSKEVTPFLHGSIGEIGASAIHIDNDINPIVQSLYQSLSQAHPEAGKAYWLTRTWDLLCWQPMYVAFISIYGFHTLPNLRGMGQYVQQGFVTGYRFADEQHIHGEIEELIVEAGKQIRALYDFYQIQISDWTRIRPGFTHQLMSDGVMACLIRLQQHFPQFSDELIHQHAKLWLEALGLSSENTSSLYAFSDERPLKLVRKSCCLVYKCEGRKLCEDCPRTEENKQLVKSRSTVK